MSSHQFPIALKTLASYLAGQFDNREQASAEPTWYVPLYLWQRPVDLFPKDGITLFIEQANILTPDQPYRQRLLRLQVSSGKLRGQYYALKDFVAWRGAGSDRARLAHLTPNDIEELPECVVNITQHDDQFKASLPTDTTCRFTYQGKTGCVSLGFQASAEEFLSYDKGIDPATGRALWGAIMGPFQFKKRQCFQSELPVI